MTYQDPEDLRERGKDGFMLRADVSSDHKSHRQCVDVFTVSRTEVTQCYGIDTYVVVYYTQWKDATLCSVFLVTVTINRDILFYSMLHWT